MLKPTVGGWGALASTLCGIHQKGLQYDQKRLNTANSLDRGPNDV